MKIQYLFLYLFYFIVNIYQLLFYSTDNQFEHRNLNVVCQDPQILFIDVDTGKCINKDSCIEENSLKIAEDQCWSCKKQEGETISCKACHPLCKSGECKEEYEADQCTFCTDGYYLDPTTSACKACNNNCKQCDQTNSTVCFSCMDNYFYHIEKQFCYTQYECPTGTYGNPSSKQCESCSNSCLTCKDISSTCTSCHTVDSEYTYFIEELNECITQQQKSTYLTDLYTNIQTTETFYRITLIIYKNQQTTD